MAYSHSQLVERFKDGKIQGSSSSMFIEGDTLYSYGRHFPLLIRVPHWKNGYIMNADKYSVSTSGHQAHCMGLATIQVPFSALGNAIPDIRRQVGVRHNLSFDKLHLIAVEAQRWDTTGYYHIRSHYSLWEPTRSRITVATYNALDEIEQKDYREAYERRPESAVLKYNHRYFLSSMDGNNYFICQLPYAVATIKEAFESLIPKAVGDKEYQRQGEWFFVNLDMETSKAKALYKRMGKKYTLPHLNRGNPHTATRGCKINGVHIVSGQVKHPEHRMTRLSRVDNPMMFAAYPNTAKGSWSASGQVD